MHTILNTRQDHSQAWFILERGEKCLTLKFQTIVQGERDVTIHYPLEAESTLIHLITEHIPGYGIEQLAEKMGEAPDFIDITYDEPLV